MSCDIRDAVMGALQISGDDHHHLGSHEHTTTALRALSAYYKHVQTSRIELTFSFAITYNGLVRQVAL